MGENFAEYAQKKSDAQDHAPLFVSLYIVLLAFFIMLNTIATPVKEKSDNVLEAVKLKFSFARPLEIDALNPTTDASGDTIKAFFKAVREHSARFIPHDHPALNDKGDLIEIAIPQATLFDESGALTASTTELLYDYARAMQDVPLGYRVNMHALFDAPKQSVIDYYQGNNNTDMYRKAGLMARTLEARSPEIMPQIAIGLRTGTRALVRFRFWLEPDT